MITILFQIFFLSFFLNLLWEFAHCRLYVTCLKAPFRKLTVLLVGASFKDAFWISLFFLISALVFRNTNILSNQFQILFFIFLSLLFSFIDEKISVKLKRWEYSEKMPRIFGVGITPLLELAVTGIIAFFFAA